MSLRRHIPRDQLHPLLIPGKKKEKEKTVGNDENVTYTNEDETKKERCIGRGAFNEKLTAPSGEPTTKEETTHIHTKLLFVSVRPSIDTRSYYVGLVGGHIGGYIDRKEMKRTTGL
jgi:hypothetical protein